MNVILTKFKLLDSRKLVNFGKYFLISLLLLLGLHLAAHANNPEVIIQPEWTVNLQASTEMITTGDRLFVVANSKHDPETEDYSATLFAINTESGKELWQQKLPNYQTLGNRKLILDDGFIYVSHDQGVVGFDMQTGTPQFSLTYDDQTRSGIRDRLMGVHKGIIIYGDSIPTKDSDFTSRTEYQTKVFGFNVFGKDKMLWSYQLPKTNGLIDIPAIKTLVQNGILLLPSFHDKGTNRIEQFTVIDVTSGKILWNWESKERDSLYGASVWEDTLYTSVFGNSDMKSSGRLRAIDLKTGKEKWSYVITGKVKAVSDLEVYVWQSNGNSGNNFVVLDKETGRFLRRFELPRVYYDEPPDLVLADGLIYVFDMEIKNATFGFYGSADNNSWISAFDAKTGKLVWRTPTLMNTHVYHLPVISDVDPKSGKRKLIFASNFLRKEGSSKLQAFSIP